MSSQAAQYVNLQDRVLILQDKVDVLKTFDPDQPRNKDGEWSKTGGGPNMSRRGFLGGLLSTTAALQVPAVSFTPTLALATPAVDPGKLYNLYSVGGQVAARRRVERVLASEASSLLRFHSDALPSKDKPQYFLFGDDKVPYQWDGSGFKAAQGKLSAAVERAMGFWQSPEQMASNRALNEPGLEEQRSKRAAEEREQVRQRERKKQEEDERQRASVHHASDLDEFVAGRIRFRKLQDRVLVLQDKVDSLGKTFDPDQPRDNAGKWSTVRGGGVGVSRGHKEIDVVVPFGTGDDLTTAHYAAVFDKDIIRIAEAHGAEIEGSGAGFGARDLSFKVPTEQVPSFQRAIAEFSRSVNMGSKIEFHDLGVRQEHPDNDDKAGGGRGKVPRVASAKKLKELRARMDAGDVSVLQEAMSYDNFSWESKFTKVLIRKAFDPDQPRDKAGKWSLSGLGSGLKGAAHWLSPSKVRTAAKSAAAGEYNERAKDVVAETVATLITTHLNNYDATEAVKQSLLHGAAKMEISVGEAREKVSRTLNRLRAMRSREKPDVAKAEDPVLELLTKFIEALDNLDLDEDKVDTISVGLA